MLNTSMRRQTAATKYNKCRDSPGETNKYQYTKHWFKNKKIFDSKNIKHNI